MRRALLLVERLLTYPESRFRAEFQGEEVSAWHWPSAQRVLADMYDMQKSLLAAFGGVQIKSDDLYPRPHIEEPDAPVPTIAEFNVAEFMRTISS